MNNMLKSSSIRLCFIVGLILITLVVAASAPWWWTITMLVIALLVFYIAPITFYNKEKKKYNNGKCPFCGEELEHFASDSQGSLGYCCPKCHKHYIWLAWFNPKNSKEKKDES